MVERAGAPSIVIPSRVPREPMAERLRGALDAERQTIDGALARLAGQVDGLAGIGERLLATLRAGNTVLVAGNGGSAAAAQHFAAELVGRFRRERRPYAALALTTDSATLTALANDYGYTQVFARQVEALGRPGDLLLALSTSGESDNLILAADAARCRGLAVVALTGARPSRLAERASLALRVPAPEVASVQLLHLIVIHLLCDLVESALALDDEGIVHDAPGPVPGS